MDYPQNLSESDCQWYNLIQQCRASGKSNRQWLTEFNICSPTFCYHVKQFRKKFLQVFIPSYRKIGYGSDSDSGFTTGKNSTMISETVSQSDETALT